VQENILYQDNQSAILLEKNGKASSSKRTKHINIRFFFVTDRIAQKELSVEWCPTGDMIADFMTKPTQGALFTKFRDQIMGVKPVSGPSKNVSFSPKLSFSTKLPTRMSTQECVGETPPGTKNRASASEKESSSSKSSSSNKSNTKGA
jgi:hypothetical protein